ncbi:Peptidyl-prolyl cis-trans isomerase FKBP13, chloroplastic-like protein [Drosera capensis]
MSSVRIPLSLPTPTKPVTPSLSSLPIKILKTTPTSTVTDELGKEKKSCSLSLKRREIAVLGVLGVGLRPAVAEEGGSSCEFTVAPSGLGFCDKVLGSGIPAIKGQLIKAHYVGKLENGKVFDSSYNRGKPLTFRVGVGEVIKGWDQGILGADGVPAMLPGGKRTLKLPPELGYGARGAGCRGGSCIIPPDSVLLFDVEFIG